MKELDKLSKAVLEAVTEQTAIEAVKQIQDAAQQDNFPITVSQAFLEVYGVEDIPAEMNINWFGVIKTVKHPRLTLGIARRYCAAKARHELSPSLYYPSEKSGISGRAAMYPRQWLYSKLKEFEALHVPKLFRIMMKSLQELTNEE